VRLVESGLRPVLIDEAPRIGGQIFRQPPELPGFLRSRSELYGASSAQAEALFSDFERVRASVDYHPGWLVYDLIDNTLIATDGRQSFTMPFDALILATGATDRVIPSPGWTLPGVFSLGGAQIALKYQGCAIGRRAIFAGTGPLLLLGAYQYAKAGAQPRAVVLTSNRLDLAKGAFALLRHPIAIWRGLRWLFSLLGHGVPIVFGAHINRILGETRVSGLELAFSDGKTQKLECDAVAIGYGLRSETQLAELAGARFGFDEQERQYLPDLDPAGRVAGLTGIYLAGDGAGILGAEAAEAKGRLAAEAALQDLGLPVNDANQVSDLKIVAKAGAFQAAMRRAFPYPMKLSAKLPDEAIVCRCEEVTAGDIRTAGSIRGVDDINRVKALTRLGMGRCQGRMCASSATEILAASRRCKISAAGRLRCQPPIKPVSVEALATNPRAE
jgi:NADPH-dependent 2,4-dienoyl-CoA reductase/sulfur reductase-like enzyme